jgi:ATP-dependent Clp protease ATP-binding subunit ClpC
MVVRIGKHLLDQDLKLDISDKAKDKIAEEGFDKVYGARPMRRVIQRVIEDPLSEELLRFKYKAGDTILVDVDEKGEIALTQVAGKPAKAIKEPKEPKEPAATAAPAVKPEADA